MSTRRSTYAARRRGSVGPVCVPFYETSFQQADGPLPAPWYTPAAYAAFAPEVQSNRAVAPLTLGVALLADSESANQIASVRVDISNPNDYARLSFRTTADLTRSYGVQVTNTAGTVHVQWFKADGGAPTPIGPEVTFPLPGTTFVIQGSVIDDLLASRIIGVLGVDEGPSVTDSDITSGELGIVFGLQAALEYYGAQLCP